MGDFLHTERNFDVIFATAIVEEFSFFAKVCCTPDVIPVLHELHCNVKVSVIPNDSL